METKTARRPLLGGLAASALLPLPALADESDAPLLVLREANPWAAVIGAESARFVLYGDGTVIYGLPDGRLKSVKLDPTEREKLVRDIGFAVLPRFAGRYWTTSATDQIEQWLILFGERRTRVIYVYGRLDRLEARTQTPVPVVGAYDRLVHFDHPRARDWLPERIEVMILPFDHATIEALDWPAGWPRLDDPLTRKWREGGYSLFLPAARIGELKALFARRRPNQPVALAGRKWWISARYPLPNERLWLRALAG